MREISRLQCQRAYVIFINSEIGISMPPVPSRSEPTRARAFWIPKKTLGSVPSDLLGRLRRFCRFIFQINDQRTPFVSFAAILAVHELAALRSRIKPSAKR
jgi:hypothetical protein